jgi:hypothetical protein
MENDVVVFSINDPYLLGVETPNHQVIRRPMNSHWASLLERIRFFLRQALLSLQQRAESQKSQ